MNRLEHSCSYSILEETDTALCIEKLENVDCISVPLPSNVQPHVPTVLAFDNIDRQEEVLSGAGTSHRVNGIIVQPPTLPKSVPNPIPAPKKRDKRRTIPFSHQSLPVYISGKRTGPPPVSPANIIEHLENASAQSLTQNHLWVFARLFDVRDQKINSWTGFNIKTRDVIDVPADNLGYLPTINAPATEMSTVQEILSESMVIKESLHLASIAVVLDQALYSKATEIAWKHHERYNNVILMMGNFHIICNLLSTIGKLFGDAGMRDLAVESGVIAAGSVDKVLEGKHYNRAVRFHKLMYEALIRVAYKGFVEWLDINRPEDATSLDDIQPLLNDLCTNTCSETFKCVLNDRTCQKVLEYFREYTRHLKESNGPLSKFWMQYVEMVEIMLGLLWADREGNWYLHLACIRRMIPWCFAMDRINYSRYLSVYFNQMTHLEEVCPELYAHFVRGGFSVQHKQGNPFGRIAVDQTTEETVNKDTQTAGGTRGFSLKPGTVACYYLAAEH